MVVRPADHLVREHGIGLQRGHDPLRQVEDHVVAGSGQPDHDVVLRRRMCVSTRPDDRLVEPLDPDRRCVGRHSRPELGTESGDEVDATDRRPRLPETRHERDGRRRIGNGTEVELEIGVRRRAEREDPRLR